MEERDDIIILKDDDVNELEFQFVDTVHYKGEEFAVLIELNDEDEESEEYEVVILKVEEDGEELSFFTVEDEKLLNEIFEYFKSYMEDE